MLTSLTVRVCMLLSCMTAAATTNSKGIQTFVASCIVFSGRCKRVLRLYKVIALLPKELQELLEHFW